MFDRYVKDLKDSLWGSLSTHDAFLAAASTENRWRNEIDKIAASGFKSWMPEPCLHDSLKNQIQRLAQEQTAASQLALAGLRKSWQEELEKSATATYSAWQVSSAEKAWQQANARDYQRALEAATMPDYQKFAGLALVDRHAEAIKKIRKSLDTASYCTGISDIVSESFVKRIASSYDLAYQAATASLADAFASSTENIAKQHAREFERLTQQFVGYLDHAPLGLAATWELAQKQSLQQQFSALGINIESWLPSEEDDSQLEIEDESQQGLGLPVFRLDDLRQLLINLVASAIWAAMTWTAVSGLEGGQQEKGPQQLENLMEQLPKLIAPLVETAVRKELGLNRATFVVQERQAYLRAKPESGSKVVAQIFPNQMLTLLEETGKWIHVEFYDYVAQDVRVGWVLKKYVRRLPSSATTWRHEDG